MRDHRKEAKILKGFGRLLVRQGIRLIIYCCNKVINIICIIKNYRILRMIGKERDKEGKSAGISIGKNKIIIFFFFCQIKSKTEFFFEKKKCFNDFF